MWLALEGILIGVWLHLVQIVGRWSLDGIISRLISVLTNQLACNFNGQAKE